MHSGACSLAGLMEATKIEDAAKAKAEQESQAQTVESSGSEPTGTSRFYCSRLAAWSPPSSRIAYTSPPLSARCAAILRPLTATEHTQTHTHRRTHTRTRTPTHTPHNTTYMPPSPPPPHHNSETPTIRAYTDGFTQHTHCTCAESAMAHRCVQMHRKRRGSRQATGRVLHNNGRRALCKRDARHPSRLLGSAQ
jgi:hypothetical protein